MKLSLPNALLAVTLAATSAAAATIDMNDPRRAVGREDDIRIDAQIRDENVASGSPISVTYQIQNFTHNAIAVAPKVAAATYDADEQTITVGIGSEIPDGGVVPQLVTIEPGEKKTFTVAASARFLVRNLRTSFSNAPRFVRVKVSVLRDLAPFRHLLGVERTAAGVQLDDQLFERWLESSDTIFLSAIPVRYAPQRHAIAGAEARSVDDPF